MSADPETVELGWSARSAQHVILHPQPERPAGQPFFAVATACGKWLQGLRGNYWHTPGGALKSTRCAGCRRYIRRWRSS